MSLTVLYATISPTTSIGIAWVDFFGGYAVKTWSNYTVYNCNLAAIGADSITKSIYLRLFLLRFRRLCDADIGRSRPQGVKYVVFPALALIQFGPISA
jgi:hypothetical protein